MKRTQFIGVSAGVAVAMAAESLAAPNLPKEIAGIRLPDSTLARDATELARSVEPPEIFNHSLRSFVFAELVAQGRDTKHDAELVYVASILHDVGLTDRYRSPKERFEVDGANAARAFLAQNGISGGRADLVWDAIALHATSNIARWKQNEVMLTNAGIVTDVGGAYIAQLPPDAIKAVLRAAPRTNFTAVFLDALAVVARQKPLSTAGSFVADVGYRLVPGFTLPNFVDGMREGDPFDAFTR